MNIWVLLPIFLPIIAGACLLLPVFGTCHKRRRYYITAVVLLNAAIVLLFANMGEMGLRVFEITPAISVYLRVDELARLFMVLASLLWVPITFFAFEYIKPDGNKDIRFFIFFLMTYGVIIGATVAGNFFTLYLFYELATLLTYPLVIHAGTPVAMRAGAKYLIYSFFGAGLAFLCFVAVSYFGVTADFVAGGVFTPEVLAANEGLLLAMFLLAFIGFGTKAYIWPLFEWVPASYPTAPAPAAALLSGIVSKIAVIAILRVTFYIFGADFLQGSWAQAVLTGMAVFTLFAGSMLAFRERLFKRRLAYSSVSQLSYILFGIVLLNPIAFLGAMVHVVFHGIVKVALFLSAGAVEHKTGLRYVEQLKGIGKVMPVTMWCFAIAAVSLIGVPPTGGFISKWHLVLGSVSSGTVLGIVGAVVLIASAILTAGYLVPIFANAFFPGDDFDYKNLAKAEPKRGMTIPLIVLSASGVVLGMFAFFIIGFVRDIAALVF